MYIVILVTTPNKKEARRIASGLLKKKLAACINIIDGAESLFWWQGKLERSTEALMVIKSKKEKLAAVTKLIKSMHSYGVPEIIALPITGGEKKYLRWIDGILR
ncbi:MAG: divalent-cation tolerance protein CutA [Candidatus Omnitrophica bacterium]|nr:divalent-cation tolerance protein CutA [Candidatus Omnitrophota bacterium]